MSASILYSVSSRTKLILDHVIQYLDAVSSSLATKAAQTTIANNVSSTLANTDTLVTLVPSTTADKTTLDLTKGVADEILLDTASIQPNVATMYSWTSEIVTDTRELVTDVNEVLLDTAALDSRLNATWSGRLDTSVSSRLSSAVRTLKVFSGAGYLASNGTSPDNSFTNIAMSGITNSSKCVFFGVVGFATSGDANTYASSLMGYARATSTTNLRLYAGKSGYTRSSVQGVLVEFY